MPTVQVPLSSDVMTNVDQTSARDGSFLLYNATVDENGATVGLPGIASFYTGLSSSTSSNDSGPLKPVISGLFWASKRNVLAVAVGQIVAGLSLSNVIQGGTVYGTVLNQQDPAGNNRRSPQLSIVDISQYLTSNGRIGTMGASPARFMYDGGDKLFAVGKGAPYICEFLQTSALSPTVLNCIGPNLNATGVPTIANMPTSSTHFAYLDTYALLNQSGTNIFNFSNVNDVNTWSASDLASAKGSEDNITAIIVLNRRIYLFGRQSIEIWENDGITPFSRVSGGFIEGGALAQYSVVVANQSLYWLDASRRFATFSGSDVSYLTSPFDAEIATLPVVTDAEGYSFNLNGDTCIVWDFPAAQRTYLLKLRGDGMIWSQIGSWNGDTYMGSKVTGWTTIPEVGVTLCYGKGSSTIYALDPNVRTNAVDSTPIRFSRVTGHLDFGTHKRKLAKEMLIRLKRGYGTSTTPPYAMLRWRDNGEGPWTGERLIDLGLQGNREITARLPRMGVFRTRQFEIAITDAVPVSIVSAEMDVEVLG